MPDDTASLRHAIMEPMRDFVTNVPFMPYRDQGHRNLMLMAAFLAGAAIMAETLAGPGAGKPMVEYAEMLKQRFDGLKDMQGRFQGIQLQ